MTIKLPRKLNKEPLIDAMFEMRFNSDISPASIVPGYLFSKLDGQKSIERLPTEQLPKVILESDPNLCFAPLIRLHWEGFIISIGERSLAIGCKMPYQGWAGFKPAIIKIVGELRHIGIVQSVHRFSMKYVDLIPMSGLKEQVSAVNGSLTLGGHSLEAEVFQVRLELPAGDMLHAVQIMSSAVANMPDGSIREGLVVDIDTILVMDEMPFDGWIENLPSKLDEMHSANKEMFFSCLSQGAIESLDPVYG